MHHVKNVELLLHNSEAVVLWYQVELEGSDREGRCYE